MWGGVDDMRLLIAAGMVVVSVPAAAGVPLWQKVEHGMTVEALRAAYPAEKGRVKHDKGTTTFKNAVAVGSCTVDAVAHHEKGVVDKVTVSDLFCDDAAFAALVTKYGKPLSDENIKDDSLLAGKDDKTRRSIWVKDGVTVSMKTDEAGIWKITYRVLENSGL